MIISFLIGMVVGAALLYWRNKVVKRESRRIPKEWPLKRRPLVNTAERRVWIWLAKIMFDQQILVKLPVTRFTAPADMQEATHWYQLLNGVYCTFTVCGMDGKVIGCVDVAGRRGLSMSNQTLKHGLLAQCGVHYWIVDPDNLPHLTQIRTAFLGERALSRPDANQLDSRLKNSANNLQAAVSRKRSSMHSHISKLEAELGDNSGYGESPSTSGWEQNSFVTPLDSRKAELR